MSAVASGLLDHTNGNAMFKLVTAEAIIEQLSDADPEWTYVIEEFGAWVKIKVYDDAGEFLGYWGS